MDEPAKEETVLTFEWQASGNAPLEVYQFLSAYLGARILPVTLQGPGGEAWSGTFHIIHISLSTFMGLNRARVTLKEVAA